MKSRRGISSVVGMVFSIIALTTVVTYVSYSMNTLDQYNQAVLNKNQQTLDLGSEKFQIVGATVVGGKFNITIANTGNLPINFTKVWIQNKTAMSQGIDWTRSWTPVNNFVAPGGIVTNIGQNQQIRFAATSPSYHFKVVTSRGSMQEFDVNSGGTKPIFQQLNILPKVVAPGYTTTLLYTVMNNQSGNTILLNVNPQILTPSTTGAATYTYVSGPTPAQFTSLGPGQAVTFKWVYTISGNDGDTVTFTTSLVNGLGSVSDTVTVQSVQFAAESKTSLQTQGLVCCKTNDQIVVLHQETGDVPGGSLGSKMQLYSGQTDAAGYTIPFTYGTTKKVYFITQNDTSTPVNIPPGDWKMVFLYKSSPVPSSVATQPSMIFFFNQTSQSCSRLCDSSGNNNQMTTGSGTAAPSFSSSCSRDNSGCYTFNAANNQYLTVPLGSSNNLGKYNGVGQALAGWFMATTYPSVGAKGTIYRTEATAATNFFDVYLDGTSHKLVFSFNTGTTTTTCTVLQTIGLNDWNYFVAERTGNDACTLYVNGTQYSNSAGGGGSSNDAITPTTAIYIGKGPSVINTAFTGSIDYLMYWNSYTPTTTDIGTSSTNGLYSKTFNSISHHVTIRFDSLDKNGNTLTNFYSNSFALPFHDGFGKTDGTQWTYYNATMPGLMNSTLGDDHFHFINGERLQINVTAANWPVTDSDMSWRIDDTTFTNNVYSSYLWIPPADNSFPSYFTYSKATQLKVSVTNAGPDGLWLISSGTRAVFQNPTLGGISYAAIAMGDNGTNGVNAMSPTQDSFFIPIYKNISIYFSQPAQVPASAPNSQNNIIATGHYRLYITIIGYDDQGNTVFKQYYIGYVNVTA